MTFLKVAAALAALSFCSTSVLAQGNVEKGQHVDFATDKHMRLKPGANPGTTAKPTGPSKNNAARSSGFGAPRGQQGRYQGGYGPGIGTGLAIGIIGSAIEAGQSFEEDDEIIEERPRRRKHRKQR